MINTVYNNLLYQEGEVLLPGVKRKIYAISKKDIASFPKLPTEGESMGILATLTDDFTLVAGKSFIEIDIRQTDSSISSESQGDKPSRTFLNKATFVYNGVGEDATSFARMANNDDFVYVWQTMDGKYRLLGNENWPTSTKPSQTNGSNVTDKAGTTFEIEVTDLCPSPFFSGTITLEDGTLDCSTNTFTPDAG